MAFGADRSVKVNLTASVTDFIGKFTAAQKKTVDLSRDIQKMSKQQKDSFDKIGRGATIGGAAIVAALGGAAKAYMEFEASMSGVAAVADASAADLERLSQAAISAGQDTIFSATEAAQAEAELAKAGVAVADILSGGLKGSLDLAAAGQIGLADAATISAQAMNIFNLEGRDVSHIADVLTAGANKSAAGVQDLGQALSQGGLLAKQTGLSLEETVGALSAFADNALLGSDAGTSLKTMLQRLTPQTDKAAELMEQMGLSAYDAQGNFVGLATYAGKLQKALADKTAEERNSTMQTLFGSDAVRAANILYEEGAAGINTYVAAVNDIGAAQRMAARQTDNLKGDLEQLKGTLETAFINAGSGGNEGLRELVHAVTTLVDKFNELSPAQQETIVKLAAITAGALLLTGGAIKATTAVLALKNTMAQAGTTAQRTGKELGILGKIAGTAAATVAALAAADSALFDGPGAINARRLATEIEAADGAIQAINASIKDAGDVADGFDSRIGNVNDALRATFDPSHWQQVGDQLNGVFSIFGRENTSDVAVAGQRLSEVDAALQSMVNSGRAEQASQAFFQIQQAANKQGISLKELEDRFPGYLEAIDNLASGGSAAAGSQDDLSENLQNVRDYADDAKDSVDGYIKSLQDAGLVVLDSRAAEREFRESVAAVTETIDKNRDALIKERIEKDTSKRSDEEKRKAAEAWMKANEGLAKTLDINTEAGRNNQKVLDDVARSALDRAQQKYDETGSEDAYRESLVKSKTELLKVAAQYGLTGQAAQDYVNEVLQIPPKVTTVAEFKTVGLGSLREAGEYLKGLKDRNVTLTVGTVRLNDGTRVNAGQFADGGPVTGPGTATSDSIPAYLSNGEYVIKAAAVARYGSHFFDQLNTMRFASGGLVGAAQQNMSTTHTETHNAPVYIEKVVGATVADIEREAEQRRRLHALGRRRA